MNDTTSSNPYLVVGSPNYATPVLNLFGDKSPTQGQQANQQNKAQPTQGIDYAAILKRIFGQQPGIMGGTGGGLGGLY